MKLVGHVTILWKIHCNWPLIDVFTMLPFLCLVKIFVLVFIPIAIVAITFFTVSGIGGGKSKSASVKLVDNQRICLTFFSDQVNWKEAVDRCAAYNQTLLRRELMDSYSDYISEHSNVFASLGVPIQFSIQSNCCRVAGKGRCYPAKKSIKLFST